MIILKKIHNEIVKIRKIFVLGCLLVLFLIGSVNAEIIRNISVSGNQRMDAESVRILADVKIGDNLNSESLNQIVKKLQTANLFQSVNAIIFNGTLNIKLVEAQIVNQVTIEGNDEISTEDLKKEIRLNSRSSFDESVIGGDVSRMLVVYQRQGFFGTKIHPQKIELSDNRVNIVYEISEGHPTYIDNIEFVGNEKFSDRTLRAEILSRHHSWWRVMSQFDVFDEDRIKYDQQLLAGFYLRNGHADFKIKSANGVFSSDRQWYSVKFEVEEGKKYKFGNLEIENPFADIDIEVLNDKLKMETGDTYNVDMVDKTISALRGVVAEQGYAFINVDVVPDKDDDARTIGLKFDIQKTKRVYLNSINILGNVRTFDSVIEQLTPMRAGDPFSLQTIEDGRQRMMRTGFFKSVDMVPTRVSDSNLMNLDIKLEEQPTGELSGGVGWSNINGFMIDAGITEKNFMGRGQIVQLKGSLAQYQKQATFSFTEPYLFGRQLSAGFDVNYTVYDYSSLGSYGYDRDTISLSGRMGWRLTDNWTQSVVLNASFDQNYDLHAPDGWQIANLYTLSTNFKYYNLDTDFAQNTHTGVVANFGLAYTGFGSTETFMRYSSDVTGMVKFFDSRWQLKSGLEFGYLQPLDGDYISRVYRYFLGGESLRGFDIAGLGSRNWAYRSYALGGMWKANGSTQLNFPIFIPDEYQIKGFVFSDYGVIGEPPTAENYYPTTCTLESCENFIDQNIRASWGVGVYWNTPMGPMNFSWGWPMLKESYDREQRFLLSFETQF